MEVCVFKKNAKKLFFQALKLAKKQTKHLPIETKALIKERLAFFQNQITTNQPALEKQSVEDFKVFKKQTLDLKGFKKWFHFTYTTALALLAALVIRQMWFELYKVPTGSMRPTIKELDHLTVSKLNFSLNVPFSLKHFYFDPNLVKRSSICVFTSENMDVADQDTRYFYIIPGKKLLVKRLIAKPGDTIYFYGGKIYGYDSLGQDITPLLNPSNISLIDHIPFIQWYGEKEQNLGERQGTIYHMNAPYASYETFQGFKMVIPENLRNQDLIQTQDMSLYWGLDNYAQARILNQSTKRKLYPQDNISSSKGLYLELRHHPFIAKNTNQESQIPIKLQTSIIPLDDRLSKKLFGQLYTARFEVQNGTLRRYGSQISFDSKQLPKLHHIPDGTYEFYYGKPTKSFLVESKKS